MAHNIRDNPTQAIAVTNWTEDLSLDCDAGVDITSSLSGTVLALSDVVGTIVNELQKVGIITGSTAA